MNKTLLTIALISFLALAKPAAAQDFDFGKVTDQELDMKYYPKDTSAHAVVLQEYGRSRINSDNDDNFIIYYEYHVKIKIFDDKGFDKGTVKVPVYNSADNERFQTVSDIKGITSYKDDDGTVKQVELVNKNVYMQKESKHFGSYSFALPGLKKGCVIEYTYNMESPYPFDMPGWTFQDNIPKVYSEYEVHIPAFWTFNASLRGPLKLTKNSGTIENKCFVAGANRCDCSLLVFGMQDIPAFIEEDYMTSKSNFISSIDFEIADFTSPYTGVKKKFAKEWADVDYQLKTDAYLCGQTKKKSLFKDRLVPVLIGKTDSLERAKAVYTYIQGLIKWDGTLRFESEDGISKAVDSHTGTSADINLALVTALKAAGINTETVVLSTRANGKLNTLYPIIDEFNYVIAKANIGGKSYLLDATDPLLPFGTLPLRCLNDKGRAFSFEAPSYWVDLNLPQKEKTRVTMDLTLGDDGKLKGSISYYSVGYDAYEKRTAIKKFNSIDEYVEDVASHAPKVKILKSSVENVDSLEKPVIETYDVEISLFDKIGGNKLAFNPYYFNKITENPFKLKERSYPVDWGMSSEDTYVVTIHLPAQYVVQSPPQPVSMALPNDGGMFVTAYQSEGGTFTFSNMIKFNKSIYSAEEYSYLKQLYNNIIQSEKAELVFVKKP